MKRPPVAIMLLTVGLAILWQFPTYWYAGHDDESTYEWFQLNEEIPGWTFIEEPVGDAAEAVLAADKMSNGTYKNEVGHLVRTFSAKRYKEKENAVGLFSHTPDRCWTNTGMVIERMAPYFLEMEIDGVKMVLERRVFSIGPLKELVYFGALVGGEALPYRLDQYFASGLVSEDGAKDDRQGSLDRLVSSRVWSWALESFVKRARLAGPQQLIRVSTPVKDSVEEADERLSGFLQQWLTVIPYEEDLETLKTELEDDE